MKHQHKIFALFALMLIVFILYLMNFATKDDLLQGIRPSEIHVLEVDSSFRIDQIESKFSFTYYTPPPHRASAIILRDHRPVYLPCVCGKEVKSETLCNQNLCEVKKYYGVSQASTNEEQALLALRRMGLSHLMQRPTFKDYNHLFTELNQYRSSGFRYVLLRNFDELQTSTDIDILVSDYFFFKKISGGRNRYPDNMVSNGGYRIQNLVTVNEKEILFDSRYVGDGYFDEKWGMEMLQRGENLAEIPFYHVGKMDHCFSLLYHIFAHKNDVTYQQHRYNQKLGALGCGFSSDIQSNAMDLKSFMITKGYHTTIPNDKLVARNETQLDFYQLNL